MAVRTLTYNSAVAGLTPEQEEVSGNVVYHISAQRGYSSRTSDNGKRKQGAGDGGVVVVIVVV